MATLPRWGECDLRLSGLTLDIGRFIKHIRPRGLTHAPRAQRKADARETNVPT